MRRSCRVSFPQLGGSGLPALLSCVLLSFVIGLRAQAGPPFQTDDPTPVDHGHYEAYIFGGVDGTTAELDTISPGFEFNWGAILFAYGHSVAGQTENYAYLGLYKTWGKDKDKPETTTDRMRSAQQH